MSLPFALSVRFGTLGIASFRRAPLPSTLRFIEFRVILCTIVCLCVPLAAASAQSERAENAEPCCARAA